MTRPTIRPAHKICLGLYFFGLGMGWEIRSASAQFAQPPPSWPPVYSPTYPLTQRPPVMEVPTDRQQPRNGPGGPNIEIPPLFSFRQSDTYGLALGIFGNISRGGGAYGLSLAGVANLHDQGGAGLHIAGLFNHDGGLFRGLQLALLNSAKDLSGVQLSVTANVTTGRTVGLQIGPANYNSYGSGEFEGLQLGAINVAGVARGFQFGVVNTARQVRGLQFGLINVCRKLYGAQIGLLNLHLDNRLMPAMIIMNIGLNAG